MKSRLFESEKLLFSDGLFLLASPRSDPACPHIVHNRALVAES
jgi:hypothetical protein